MGLLDIDVTDFPDQDTIPNGQYRLRVDDASGPYQDKNRDNFLKITYRVVNGDHVNRGFADNYVPLAKNHPRASTIKRLLKSAGVANLHIKQAEDLVGLEMDAMVGVRSDANFGDQNVVTSFIVPGEPVGAGKSGLRR